ncbi:phytase [Irpex rosettiformis]|uniref:Phytase n=1 Tax=Irpex rosettiformis TaxID=378272 RepID=A0ACB8U4Z5_9APHY|nr:phytase [Irpex rosettiformis]
MSVTKLWLVVLCYVALGVAEVRTITPRLPVAESEQLNWAAYSPYFPAADYKNPPVGCKVDQVNIIQRHGARYPTSGATRGILSALAKLKNVTNFTDSRLDFIKTFQYTLGKDDLVQFGADQSFDAGQVSFERYQNLFKGNNTPFVRSDISARVVASANNWTAGFTSASNNTLHPKLNVILGSGTNDTLDDSQCPAAGGPSNQTAAWEAIYAAPIAAKLNSAAPGANLTANDIFNLISLCPFETVASFNKSQWCTLFEQYSTAFPGFAYEGDLDKFYGTGYGQPLGPIQGVGYTNELLARLTTTPVLDATQVNHTLDANPSTFPLDRTLYVDFSHDDEIVAVVSAIGLFRQDVLLDPTEPDEGRTWRVSAIVPFSGRVVVERLSCGVYVRSEEEEEEEEEEEGEGEGGREGREGKEARVRILVQDEVQLLPFCGGDEDGICTLSAFVESQRFARENGYGEFAKCQAGSVSA